MAELIKNKFINNIIARLGGILAEENEAGFSLAELGAAGDVVAFVSRHNIDPNPTNYELIYRHIVSREMGLDHIVNQLIANGQLESPLPDNPRARFEEDLSEIADFAHTQLRAIEVIVEQSKKDAEGFGDALEQESSSIGKKQLGEDYIGSLMSLTRTMIEQTKAAEQELKAREKVVDELQHSLADAKFRADTDALTGLSNRRAFERELGAASERAKNKKVKLALAICDIDHFKSINDNFGHVTGDRVLQLVSQILREECSPHGNVFRFGGEEFVILCEGYSSDEAEEFLEGARLDLNSRNIVKKETGEHLGKLSFSTGISEYEITGSPGELLKMADKSLYRAKANGRNMTVVHGRD